MPQDPTASTIHFNLTDGTIVLAGAAARVSSVKSEVAIDVRSIHGVAHALRIARFLQNAYAYATFFSQTVLELLERIERAEARAIGAEDALAQLRETASPPCCKAA